MSWYAVATLAITAVSTGVTIYSQQQQAEAQATSAAYNNQLAQKEAANREAEAAEASRRERLENRKKLARIRSTVAKSGVLSTTGTPLIILGESYGNLELGRRDAKRRTDMQAAALRARGQMGLWEADQAGRAANLASVGTALQGAASFGSGYTGAAYQGQVPDTFGLYRTKPAS